MTGGLPCVSSNPDKVVRFLFNSQTPSSRTSTFSGKIMIATRLVLLLVGIWLSVIYLDRADSRGVPRDATPLVPNACTNCSICQYPCQQQPPPPPFSYPVNGGAPPPPGPSGYPVYSGPPSPINCPPFPAQCCNFPPLYPYGYQPYVNNSAISCSPLVSIQLLLLLLSIAV